jgi:CheY-like chemotaxis protein
MSQEKPRREYISVDPESQRTKSEYSAVLESIERRMDPTSNTVLVVDDEPGIRKFVARGIRRSNKDIVIYEAENGKQALAVLEEIREKYSKDPALIVTDLHMPVMDGWQFIEALYKDYSSRGLKQGIPLIVLSSTSGEKGIAFFKKSIHGTKSKYEPMVAIAKEACTDASRYTARGEKGLMAWIKQFSRHTEGDA